ncbi:MAG: hypothetical protein N3A54_00760 [Patescibacteria group bacterium]|nr:hypothetical protein [Patescibacteria group bacterium]
MSLSKPETREEFIQNCLCRLGYPVIEINVSPEQCEILVDQALQKYWDYHFDGQIPVYYVHLITAQNKTNNTVVLPDKIHGVVSILPISNLSIPTTAGSVQTVSEIQQYHTLSDLIQNGGILRGNASYLYTFRTYLETLTYTLSPSISFQFNRKTNTIIFNESLAKIAEKAERLVIEGYEYIDPNEFPEVWNDEWLKEYTTALMKRQWGENMKKFSNLPLPGGATLNGEGIYNEAVTDIERLETRLYKDLQIPINFYIA